MSRQRFKEAFNLQLLEVFKAYERVSQQSQVAHAGSTDESDIFSAGMPTAVENLERSIDELGDIIWAYRER